MTKPDNLTMHDLDTYVPVKLQHGMLPCSVGPESLSPTMRPVILVLLWGQRPVMGLSISKSNEVYPLHYMWKNFGCQQSLGKSRSVDLSKYSGAKLKIFLLRSCKYDMYCIILQ